MTSTYTDRLRRFALNAPDLVEDDLGLLESGALNTKSVAIARVAALIAIGGAEPSYDELVDAAMSSGSSADEIVDVLIGLSPIVGLPRVVEAAPKLALALGYDLESDIG
jgi:alkylhydroperoxidase/carboxymuconolactone decarboxylase family protein YurZ